MGQLYINNDDGNNGYKVKAIDLYGILAEREPENPVWTEIPQGLFDNIDELLRYLKETWEKIQRI